LKRLRLLRLQEVFFMLLQLKVKFLRRALSGAIYRIK
jgi:hypothetical protein